MSFLKETTLLVNHGYGNPDYGSAEEDEDDRSGSQSKEQLSKLTMCNTELSNMAEQRPEEAEAAVVDINNINNAAFADRQHLQASLSNTSTGDVETGASQHERNQSGTDASMDLTLVADETTDIDKTLVPSEPHVTNYSPVAQQSNATSKKVVTDRTAVPQVTEPHAASKAQTLSEQERKERGIREKQIEEDRKLAEKLDYYQQAKAAGYIHNYPILMIPGNDGKVLYIAVTSCGKLRCLRCQFAESLIEDFRLVANGDHSVECGKQTRDDRLDSPWTPFESQRTVGSIFGRSVNEDADRKLAEILEHYEQAGAAGYVYTTILEPVMSTIEKDGREKRTRMKVCGKFTCTRCRRLHRYVEDVELAVQKSREKESGRDPYTGDDYERSPGPGRNQDGERGSPSRNAQKHVQMYCGTPSSPPNPGQGRERDVDTYMFGGTNRPASNMFGGTNRLAPSMFGGTNRPAPNMFGGTNKPAPNRGRGTERDVDTYRGTNEPPRGQGADRGYGGTYDRSNVADVNNRTAPGDEDRRRRVTFYNHTVSEAGGRSQGRSCGGQTEHERDDRSDTGARDAEGTEPEWVDSDGEEEQPPARFDMPPRSELDRTGLLEEDSRIERAFTPDEWEAIRRNPLRLLSLLGNRASVRRRMNDANVSSTDYEVQGLWELAELLGEVKKRGLDPHEIAHMPTMKYRGSETTKTDKGNKLRQCKICLEDFTEGENLRTLPCLHRFHQYCIDHWIQGRAVCPICRIGIKEAMTKSFHVDGQ